MSPSDAPQAVPLLLLGESRRRRLLERVERVVVDWHAVWASEGVSTPSVELSGPARACPIDTSRRGVALAAFADGELLSYVESATDFVKVLCVSSFREKLSLSFTSPRGRLEGALTEEAVGALLKSLMHAALPTATCSVRKGTRAALEATGSLWHRHALRIRVSAGASEGGRTLELDLAPRLVEALLGGRPVVSKPEPLAACRQAVEPERLTVTISLGSASVSWRDLTALSVGDAILLDQDLEASCTVSLSGSKAIAEAHVGRVDKALAVQITRIHSEERRERR